MIYQLEANFADATVTGIVQDTPVNWNLDMSFRNPSEDDHFQPGTGCYPSGNEQVNCYHGSVTPTHLYLEREGGSSAYTAVILNLDRSGNDFTGGNVQWFLGHQGGDFISGTLVPTDLPPLPGITVPEPSALGLLAAGLLLLYLFTRPFRAGGKEPI